MYDRRVVRGNTYAQHILPVVSFQLTKSDIEGDNHIGKMFPLHIVSLCIGQAAQPDPIEVQRQQESRRRSVARKRAMEQFRPRTPEALEGRKHIDVQTGKT